LEERDSYKLYIVGSAGLAQIFFSRCQGS